MAKEIDIHQIRSNPPQYMNATEAAIYLNFSLPYFHQEIKPYLHAVNLGTKKNYRKQDLDKFAESLLVSPKKLVEIKRR